MMRAVTWVLVSLLTLSGLAGVGIYTMAAVVSNDRAMLVVDYGAVFAFCVVAAATGLVATLALLKRLPPRVRVPNEWVALVAFVLAVGAGFAIVLNDRFPLATPLLALVAGGALFVFIARLVSHWSSERSIGSRELLLPSIWGAIGAPVTAGTVQLITVMLLVIGGVSGLYTADAMLLDNVEGWIERAAETTDLSVIQTPTVAFGAIGIIGVTAPLTEELTKFLGVYLVFRKRVATKYGLFIAGAAAGLGFAVVETLGYALMAVDQWPQIMLLRAPVALIHVAGTTIVALGWYKQRQSGGQWLLLMYLLAVVLHAAWNSLFVSMLILAAGFETSTDITAAEALLTLAIVSGLGAVLIASVVWIVGNARRLGREVRPVAHVNSQAPHTAHLAGSTTI